MVCILFHFDEEFAHFYHYINLYVEDAVTCQLDQKNMTGELTCRGCESNFQTTISTLTEPIDVFSEWLDETTEKQRELFEQS